MDLIWPYCSCFMIGRPEYRWLLAFCFGTVLHHLTFASDCFRSRWCILASAPPWKLYSAWTEHTEGCPSSLNGSLRYGCNYSKDLKCEGLLWNMDSSVTFSPMFHYPNQTSVQTGNGIYLIDMVIPVAGWGERLVSWLKSTKVIWFLTSLRLARYPYLTFQMN
jgi:hypothetical protein